MNANQNEDFKNPELSVRLVQFFLFAGHFPCFQP